MESAVGPRGKYSFLPLEGSSTSSIADSKHPLKWSQRLPQCLPMIPSDPAHLAGDSGGIQAALNLCVFLLLRFFSSTEFLACH